MKFWKISKQQARGFLDKLRDEMEAISPNIKVEFFSERSSVLGNTIENTNGTIEINVLRENFNDVSPLDKWSPVNWTAFATSVVTLQHECRHIQQSGKYPLSGNISDKVLISQYVSKENEEWYNQHYTEQLNEIDAEANALYEAYNKLEKAFPDCGEELILNYVNYRIDKDNEAIKNGAGMRYYIHSDEHFSSLDDVYVAFEDVAIEAQENYRLYDDKTDFKVCKDTVALGMNIKNYGSSVWDEHINVLYDASTGVESDLLMASFTNYAKGNAYDNPLLQHINLDIEDLYGIPPAQTQEELNEDMKIHEYEATACSMHIGGQFRHSEEQETDDFEL